MQTDGYDGTAKMTAVMQWTLLSTWFRFLLYEEKILVLCTFEIAKSVLQQNNFDINYTILVMWVRYRVGVTDEQQILQNNVD